MLRSLLVVPLLAACGRAERTHTQESHRREDSGLDLAVPAGPPAYGSFEEVVHAGRTAYGKAALLEFRRLVVRADMLVAEPCNGKDGDLIFIGFKPAERDLVRGLPFNEKTCGKALVKVTLVDSPGFHSKPGPDGGLVITPDSGTLVEGYALEFPGVVPKPAPTPPRGADFGDLDEIGLAGEAAEGKSAVVEGKLGMFSGALFFYPCDGHASMILDGPLDAARVPSAGDCHPVRFRIHYSSVILDAKAYRFNGTVEP